MRPPSPVVRLRRTPVRRGRLPDDDGFLLVEAVVATAVIMIVMAALAVFLASVSRGSARQHDAQAATRLAVAALDRAHAVGAAGAVSGRDASTSATQFASTPITPDHPAGAAAVSPWLATMTPAVDGSAHSGDGAAAALPTVAGHQTLDGLTYSVSTFVGYCYRDPSGAAQAGDCVASAPTADAIQYVRVVAVVAWPGTDCPSSVCAYTSAILLSGSGDPVFDLNQAGPPALALNAVPAQSSKLGQSVAGLSRVTGCASPCPVSVTNGAPPLIYAASGLPAGLAIDKATGVISGVPTATGTATVTVTVTDAFLDVARGSFTWTVTSR